MSDWPTIPAADPDEPQVDVDDARDTYEVGPTTAFGRIRAAFRPHSEPDPLSGLVAAELAGLSVAGLTRRRVLMVVAAVLMAWVVFTFVQQVGEAAAITTRADEMRRANAALEARVRAAELELVRIQESAYIEQQARAYRLGEDDEIPFSLVADPPPLGADAPGSAANRIGAEASTATPLEGWLSLLFGPLR